MKIMRRIFAVLFVVGSLLSMPANATFMTLCHGTLIGKTCTLDGADIKWVYDTDTVLGSLMVLGAPILDGESIRFQPYGTFVVSENGLNSPTVTTLFAFDQVISKRGKNIDQISAQINLGQYSIFNAGEVTSSLALSVMNNNPADPMGLIQNTTAFGSSISTGSSPINWALVNSVSPTDTTSTPHPFADALDLKLVFTTTLTASTITAGSQAWIQNDGIQLDASTTVVPLPASFWLLSSVLSCLLWVCHRVQRTNAEQVNPMIDQRVRVPAF